MRFRHATLNSGRVRTEAFAGRQHLVAPVTLLVSGVLTGSRGALYYPPDEIEPTASAWENMPLTDGHPSDGLGKDPKVFAKVGLGHVKNVRWDQRTASLRGEAWFDVALCDRVAPGLTASVRNRGKVEVSTGLFTKNEPVRNGKDERSGKSYTHVARNYRPDHLAILRHETGACSVTDGCGVNNEFSPQAREAAKVAKLKKKKSVLKGSAGEAQALADHADATQLDDRKRLAKPSTLNACTRGGTCNWCNQHGGDTCKVRTQYARKVKKSKQGNTGSKDNKVVKDQHGNTYAGQGFFGFAKTQVKNVELKAKPTLKNSQKLRQECLKHSLEAANKGDPDEAKKYRAAAHGFGLVQKHAKGGNKTKAEALLKRAYDVATGKYKLPGSKPTPTTNSSPRTSMKRSEAVQYLTANCSCWKHSGSDAVLNGLPISQLKSLYRAAIEREEMKEKLTANSSAAAQPVTFNTVEEWLKAAPEGAEQVWNTAVEMVKTEKAAVVGKLTANAQGKAKEAAVKVYEKMELDDLRALLPPPTENAKPKKKTLAEDETEAAGCHTRNAAGIPDGGPDDRTDNAYDDEPLTVPTLNFLDLSYLTDPLQKRRTG